MLLGCLVFRQVKHNAVSCHGQNRLAQISQASVTTLAMSHTCVEEASAVKSHGVQRGWSTVHNFIHVFKHRDVSTTGWSLALSGLRVQSVSGSMHPTLPMRACSAKPAFRDRLLEVE